MDNFTAVQGDRAKSYAIIACAVSVFYTIFRVFTIWRAQVKVPLAGADKMSVFAFMKARQRRFTDMWGLLEDGYKKFNKNKQAFKLARLRRNLVYIPPECLDELKNLPESTVSFREWSRTFVEERYTGIDSGKARAHEAVIRGDLTQQLGALQDTINEETAFAFRTELPCKEGEWHSFYAYASIVRVIARISSRIFVGSPTCRNEEWLRESIEYTMNIFALADRLQSWSPWANALFGWMTKEAKKVESSKKIALSIIKPEIERRREASRKAKEAGIEWAEKPRDTLQWIEERATEYEKGLQMHANMQLSLTMAAIHTSSMACTQAIFDLCAHPDVAKILREEVKEIFDKFGPKITKEAQKQLVKMDSFMKESMRLNTLGSNGFNRIITAPNGITLSNGTYLPKGTQIAFATGIQLMDPKIYPNPEKFDYTRFLKPSKEGVTPTNMFTQTSLDNLTFGYGKHACPGRFFAGNEIKTVLIALLSNYEIRFEGGSTERPKNIRNPSGTQSPNFMAKLEIRLRPESERLLPNF